jgi:hypothetical protein
MPASLSVKCNGKTYHFAFDSDSDLYDWQDDVYTRCPLGAQTTNPFGFQHIGHIGDGITGTFAVSTPPLLPFFHRLATCYIQFPSVISV